MSFIDDLLLLKKVEKKDKAEGPNYVRPPTLPIGREPTEKEIRAAEKNRNKTITQIFLTFDPVNNEYIWDEWDNVKRKDMQRSSVHVIGKKGKYLYTDLWASLTWAKAGESAIHDHLWMITHKLDPDILSEKRSSEIDLKKILIYGAIAVVVVIVGWGFIPK